VGSSLPAKYPPEAPAMILVHVPTLLTNVDGRVLLKENAANPHEPATSEQSFCSLTAAKKWAERL